MEEGERTNVATYYFTHQEREEEDKEEKEEEGEDNDDRGTASDAENGNQVDQRENLTRRKRMLHYSTEDIHLLATQVSILSVFPTCKVSISPEKLRFTLAPLAA